MHCNSSAVTLFIYNPGNYEFQITPSEPLIILQCLTMNELRIWKIVSLKIDMYYGRAQIMLIEILPKSVRDLNLIVISNLHGIVFVMLGKSPKFAT